MSQLIKIYIKINNLGRINDFSLKNTQYIKQCQVCCKKSNQGVPDSKLVGYCTIISELHSRSLIGSRVSFSHLVL